MPTPLQQALDDRPTRPIPFFAFLGVIRPLPRALNSTLPSFIFPKLACPPVHTEPLSQPQFSAPLQQSSSAPLCVSTAPLQ